MNTSQFYELLKRKYNMFMEQSKIDHFLRLRAKGIPRQLMIKGKHFTTDELVELYKLYPYKVNKEWASGKLDGSIISTRH